VEGRGTGIGSSKGRAGYGYRGSSSSSPLLDGSIGEGYYYSRGEMGGKARKILSSTADVTQFLINILVTLYQLEEVSSIIVSG